MESTKNASQEAPALPVCHLCGGTIVPPATKCSFCGVEVTEAKAAAKISPRPHAGILGPALLLLPLLFMFWMLLVVAPSHPLERPLAKLFMTAAVMFFMSAALVVIDSDRLSRSERLAAYNPVTWFALFALAWPLALPYYFRVRAMAGLANLTKVALGIVVVFFVVFGLSTAIIMAKNEKYRPSALRKGSKVIRLNTTVSPDGKPLIPPPE